MQRVVVNTHWQAARVESHLARRTGGPEIVLRPRRTPYSTRAARSRPRSRPGCWGDEPFFIVNGDSFWLDGPTPALNRVVASFDADVDAVLLVHRTFQIHSDVGFGDFAVDPWGKIRRRREREVAPYQFAGVQLADPALFANAPTGPFSLNVLWDAAIEAGAATRRGA